MPSHEEGLTVDEIDFMMTRYYQLIEQQLSTNEIIHTTFYISIVVFGAIVGVIPQLSAIEMRAPLYLFGAGIFFAMFLWTRTYLNTRQELEAQIATLLEQFSRSDSSFMNLDEIDQFFPEPGDFRYDRWEQNWLKERMLMGYYVALSGVSLLMLGADFVFLL